MEHLPIDLQRNFTLMRDLDSRATSLLKSIDTQSNEYLKNQNSYTADEKKERLDKIQGLFNKAKVSSVSMISKNIVRCSLYRKCKL